MPTIFNAIYMYKTVNLLASAYGIHLLTRERENDYFLNSPTCGRHCLLFAGHVHADILILTAYMLLKHLLIK